jgi:hypothetical protein
MIRSALLIHGVNRHFVWRAASPSLWATDRKKAKKRQLTEGMTEKTLTYLTDSCSAEPQILFLRWDDVHHAATRPPYTTKLTPRVL